MIQTGFKTLILFLLFSLIIKENVLSWTELTHENLSEYAGENSVLRTCQNETDQNCNYLKKLGFENGIEEYLQWYKDKKVKQWLAEGSNLEDAGTTMELLCGDARSYNHFHNPLKPWDSAGLDDIILNLCPPPLIPPTRNATGQSSLLWMQDSANQQTFRDGNWDWSWAKVRQVYYWGLISTTEELRQVNYAQTFRGLGHQMHLIQDAAQPDHVRNDAHPEDTLGLTRGIGLEKWSGKNKNFAPCLFERHDLLPPDVLSDCQQYNINESVNIEDYSPNVPLNISYNNLVPITQILDAEQYNGTNPSTSLSQGIAEYTNANYFSDATTFAAEIYSSGHRHYFPYPKRSSTNLQELIDKNILPETIYAEDGVEDVTLYVKKERDGEQVDHFVKPMYTTTRRWDLVGGGYVYDLDFYRDEKCHEDYAKKLLPRAVGYSAGLLDYFFRGNIEITLPDNGIYAQTDNPAQGFTSITLLAENTTSTGEAMTDGSIELVVRYKLAQEDPFQSIPVATDAEFTYVTVPEANNANSIPIGNTTELTFGTGQSTIIPLWATNVYLQVVYHGMLGNEDGAVAVGFKDISEPTPVDLFNNMDKTCLYGNWYTAGSPEAIAQVDADQNGVPEWDVHIHDIQDAYLKISNITNPISASPSDFTFYKTLVTTGNLYRAYVLSDYDYSFNLSDYMTALATAPEDTWPHASGGIISGDKPASAIKNQTDYNVESQTECDTVGATAPCEIRYYPAFYPFRGINIWGPAGYIIDNPKYPVDTECSWDSLP